MTSQQIVNILKVSIIATAIMFACELVFSFEGITNPMTDWVAGLPSWALYIAIFVIMYIQVLVPIPAYVVLNACVILNVLSLVTIQGWLIIGTIWIAYMLGAITMWFIGYKWGIKAVRWCAGSDAECDKWCDFMNNKGKWYYAGTVLLPIFPDDLLCAVAGSVKMNFWFFTIVNGICRFIGLVCMVFTLTMLDNINNSSIPYATIGWGIALLVEVVLLIIFNKRGKRDERQD